MPRGGARVGAGRKPNTDSNTKNTHGGARAGAGRKPKADSKVRKDFTAEELKELVMCEHIVSVSRKSVVYTEAFKELFWQRYNDGIDVAVIFDEAGINSKIIGRERMRDLVFGIKNKKTKEAEVVITAEEKPVIPKARKKPKHSKFSLTDEEISDMFHRLAYMSQELDFIKKIIAAETIRQLK